MIPKLLRRTLCPALCAALSVPAALAGQQPKPAPHAAAPAAQTAPRAADLSVEFSRLFPGRTAMYVEIPHVASLVSALGGSEQLLATANGLLGAAKGPKDAKQAADPKGASAAKAPPTLSAKDLNTLLDTSAAVGLLSDSGIGDMHAAIVILHMNSAEGVALLRERVFGRFGAPLTVAKVHGVEVARMPGFSYVVSGRSVLVGSDANVETVLATASSDAERLGDQPGFVSAIAKHVAGQDQVFAYASGTAIASFVGGMFGVQPARANGRGKESPSDAATRSFVGLEAIQGLATGLRFEPDAVRVRYDVEVERTRPGLVATLADPPAIEFRASSLLPADTERLTIFTVDATRIYDLAEQAFGSVPPGPGGRTFAEEVAEMERTVGVSIRSELLPALGTEVAFTGTIDSVVGGDAGGAEGAKRPLSVLALQVRDPEVVRRVVRKMFAAKPDGPALEPVDYKGAELWTLPGPASVALGRDFVLVGPVADLRRCLDAQADGTVLARTPEFAAAAGGWAGDTLFATFETAAYREATERAEAKQREAVRKQLGADAELGFFETMSLSGAIGSSMPSLVLRDGSGVHWEAEVPLGPVTGLCAYVLKQVLRDAPDAPEKPDSDESVIGVLYAVASAEANFRSDKDRFGTLDELSAEGLMPEEGVGPELKRAGYRVDVAPLGTGDGSRFECVATPVEYGKPGKLSFFVDETFVIRAADKGGAPASASDAPFTYGGDAPPDVSPTADTAPNE